MLQFDYKSRFTKSFVILKDEGVKITTQFIRYDMKGTDLND